MLIADQVRNYIALRAPAQLCDACVARHLKLRHQQANRVTMALGTTSDFSRDYGTCADCGRVQKVTGLSAVPRPVIERDEFHRHEALHTAYLASDFFDRHLLEQDFVQSDPDLRAKANQISEALGEFYQMCGARSL